MSNLFGYPSYYSQYQAQSYYSPAASPYANNSFATNPLASLLRMGQSQPFAPYAPATSISYNNFIHNSLNLLPIILRDRMVPSQPQPAQGNNMMNMLLMKMLFGGGNHFNPWGGSITQQVTRVEDNNVALLTRGAAGQSWRDAIQSGKLDDQNLESVKSFFGANINNLSDASNGGFTIELLDRRGTERKALNLEQFKSGAQYFDSTSNSWKSLSDLDIAKDNNVADVFWSKLKEKHPTLNLRYYDATTSQTLDIGTRWNSSLERQDTALMFRRDGNGAWKTELDRGGAYTEPANRIKNFFGSNLEKLTDVSNGGFTLELFDNTGKELKTMQFADFVKTAEYFDEANKAWKPLSEKASSAMDLCYKITLGKENAFKIRYTDPSTREVKDIGTRVYGHNSPVVLDSDGNSKIDLTSVKDGVQFDIDGDGKKDQVAWTQAKGDKTDAWLALDRNGNGSIDSGKELFGNQHGQDNGYEELKKFDDNKDGVIDAQDAIYAKLKTWKDTNHDGISQASEMQDLKSAGVESVNIGYKNSTEKDAHGNELRQQSAFTRTDAEAAKLAQSRGGTAAQFKSGLSVDAWLQTLRG